MASLLLDPSLILCLVFVVSCFLVIRSFRSGGIRTAPPSPPALPIIGHIHKLGRGHHHRRLQALAQSYGLLFVLRLGSVPTIVVSSASMAEAVLKTQDHVFCSRSQQHTACGMLYDCRNVAFSPYGERWRHLRRIAVVHLLGAKQVDSFSALRMEEVAGLVERTRATSGREAGVNVTELIISLANLQCHLEGGVRRQARRCQKFHELLGAIAVTDAFPRLRWVDWATGLDARVSRTAAKLDSIVERAVTDHERTRGNSDGEARDLIDDLLSVLKDGDQGFKLDRTDVKALILDMFLGGPT